MMFDFSWWPARKNKQLAEVRWKVRVEQEEKSNASDPTSLVACFTWLQQ